MVAIVSGNGLGILNGSATALGQAGMFGKAAQGANSAAAYVNAANGNLVVSERDAWLASIGVNLALTRTYNSQGNLGTGNGVNWKTGPVKTLTLSGALNSAGSSVTRLDADGSSQHYSWDAASGSYRSTDGDGAHDTLLGNADGWTWTGDARDRNGVYERYDSLGRIVASGASDTDRIRYGYNGAGQLSSVTDASGDVTTYEYQNGKLARIRTSLGDGGSAVRTYYEYDSLNRLTAVTIDMTPEDGAIADGNVYRTSYDYWDTGSQLKRIRQSDNSELNFTYDAQGRVTSVADALGQTTRFDYSVTGRTTVTDPTGNRITYGYDARGQLTSTTSQGAGGVQLVTAYYYDDAGNLTRVVSPAGSATVYEYDANGNRVLERDADGRTIRRAYDLATNLLLSETTYSGVDPDGDGAASASGAQTRRFFYDAGNQLRFAVSAEGRVTEYRYNGEHQLQSQLQYLGVAGGTAIASTASLMQWAKLAGSANVTGRVDYAYDARGQVRMASSYTGAAGSTIGAIPDTLHYTYDAGGRLLVSVDGNGKTTSYTYDELGRMLTQQAEDGTRKITSYDDARGIMSVSYYASGSNAARRVESFTFDATGQVIRSSAAHDGTRSGEVSYAYDAAGRVRLVKTADGVSTHLLYDSAGRKVAEIVGKALTEYRYDADGRLAGTVRYAADVNGALLVSAAGTLLYPSLDALRPTTLADANRSAWNNYDAAGRLVATVDAMGYLTRYGYDGAGRLVSTVQRARQVDTTLISGGVIPAAFPNEASTLDDRYTRRYYDADGNLIASLDGAGALTGYAYDGAGRLVDTTTYAGLAGVPTAAEVTLATLQARAGAVATHRRNLYDGKGQLIGIVDEANYLTEIGYDAAGNVTSRRRYATAVANPGAGTLSGLGATPAPDDRITTYTYSRAGQLLTETSPEGDQLRYGYDSAGRQVSVTRAGDGADRTSLRRYDGADRLTGELSEEGARRLAALGAAPDSVQVARIWAEFGIRYTYDEAGNRTSMTDQLGHRTLYLYSEGRLAASVNPAGNWERYTYDGFGALVEVARSTLVLSPEQMDALASSGNAGALPAGGVLLTRYYYDNEGQRTYTMDAAGGVTRSAYNAFGETERTWRYYTPVSQLAGAIGKRGHDSGAAADLGSALSGAGPAMTRNWYDTAGRLLWSADNNGIVRREYDVRGNLSAVSELAANPAGALTDAGMTRTTLANSISAALDSTRRYRYDERGLMTEVTDALGYRSVNRYTAFGEVDLVTRYAGAGGAASALDSAARTVYDRNGRVYATINGNGGVTVYDYDADGRVVEQITYARTLAATASLQDIRTAIDSQALSHAGHDLRQRFVYDANGRLAATLTLQQAVAPAGANQNGVPGSWRVVANTHDAAGRLVQRTGFGAVYPSADLKPSDAAILAWIAAPRAADPDASADSVVRYAYDAADRLVATATAQRGSGAARQWAVEQLTYDGAGNIAQRALRAAVLEADNPTDAQLSSHAATGVNEGDAVTQYRYDAMGRVTASASAMRGAGNTIEWALSTRRYDAAGNLLAVRDYANAVLGATPGNFAAPRADDSADRLLRYSYDAGGRLVTTVDATGAATSLTYDARGNVTSSTRHIKLVAGSADLARGYQPAGAAGDRVTRTFYDLGDNPVLEIGPEGALVQRRFDAAGNVIAVTARATAAGAAEIAALSGTAGAIALAERKATAADRTQFYVYYPDGALRYSIDARGYLSEKRYEPSGHVVGEYAYATPLQLAPGATQEAVAQAAARAADSQAGAAETRVTRYAYDAGGNLANSTDALGHTESYTYDALGRKRSFTNKLGNTWEYRYDAAGRLVQEKAPPVGTYADGMPATIGNWGVPQTLQLVTVLEYDTLNNLTRRTEAAGIAGKERSTEYRYDAMGRQVQTILPSLAVYDLEQNKKTIELHGLFERDSGLRTITVTYDALGNAVSNRDVGGQVSHKIYDRAGKVVAEVDADDYVTTYVRNVFGEVTSMTRHGNKNGAVEGVPASRVESLLSRNSKTDRTISYAYDAAGRVVLTTEPLVSTYSQGAAGAGYQMLARTTASEYNAFGEVYRQAVYGANADNQAMTEAAVTRWYYNARGERTAQIDALSDIGGQRSGYLTTFAYDAAGKLTHQTEFANAFGTWTDTTYADYGASDKDRSVEYKYDNLGRKTSEIRINVQYADGSAGANLVRGNLATGFEYDAVGNQIAVTDATGGKNFTYYDVLGRVIGSARKQEAPINGVVDNRIKLTEFKLDIHGNVVLRIEYADSALAADARSYQVSAAMPGNVANRITATRYDNWGRALETLDPEQFARSGARSSMLSSYDVYGRLAKQSRTVTDIHGKVTAAFQILEYDAFGRVVNLTTPGLVDLVNNGMGLANSRITQYNAFGEVTRTFIAGIAGSDRWTSYDQAGRAWYTDTDNNVDTVRLYDVHGNVTAVITGTGTDVVLDDHDNPLKQAFDEQSGALDVAKLLANDQILRTENRYNLLGQLVDSRLLPDGRLTVLVREAGKWVSKTLARGETVGDSLLVLDDASAVGAIKGLRYRLAGGAWTSATAQNLRVVEGVTVFDTVGLAAGKYEYEVILQADSGREFTRTGGQLEVARVADPGKALQIVQMYLMLYGRPAERAGLNFWLEGANKGVSTAAAFAAMLADSEARTALTGTPRQIMDKIFRNAFASAQIPTGGDEGRIAYWAQLYDAATRADGSASYAARGQVLADLLDAHVRENAAGGQALAVRANAVFNYVVTNQGNNREVASAILALAEKDPAGAIARGNQEGALERNQIALIEMYVSLFGRAPDKNGLAFWTAALGRGVSIEEAAENMLSSPEATQPWLYPSIGLTTQQYNEQLVNRAYTLALGRAPSTAELADWMTRLSGPNKITRAQFAVKFAAHVTDYKGTDTARLADRNLFTNKVSTAYQAVVVLGLSLPEGDSGSIMLDGITSAATAQEAAEKALLAAKVAAELARNAQNAADIAAGGTSLEDIRRTLTRLYIVILGRVPDQGGMSFYAPAKPYTDAQWKDIALSFLNSTEASGVLGNWRTMSNQAFVEALYKNALGNTALTPAARAELMDFVARLNGGATREQIAFEIADRMLSPKNPTPDDRTLRTLLDNRTAVGLTAGLSLTLADTAAQRTALSLVTATDVSAALNYAYSASQTALTNKLNGLRGSATTAAQLAEAMSNAAVGNTAALVANATLAANPAAANRLQITQLYVALLGRNGSFPPDVAGVQFYVDNKLPLDQVAQDFLANKEGADLYGNLTNAGYVDKVVTQMLGSATLISASKRAAWTAQLSATPAATRGKVALDIVNSVLTYTSDDALGSAGMEYLTARAALLQRVADGFVKLDADTAAEVTRITNLRTTLKSSLDTLAAQLTPLQTTMNSTEAARATAVAAATTALNNANKSGDASATKRLQIIRMYATLLQRTTTNPPTLADTNYWLNSTPEYIAQQMITSPEGSKYFKAGSTNAEFITSLYSTILGRAPNQADITYWGNYLTQNATKANVRGSLAVLMLENWGNYTDYLPSQLTHKKTVDDRIASFIGTITSAANTANNTAASTYTEAKRLNDAVTAATTAVSTAQSRVTSAQAAYTDAQDMLSLSSARRSVAQVYAQLRGSADYSGALFYIRNVARGAATVAQVADGILAAEYPAGASAFITKLYNNVLGRSPTAADITYYTGILNSWGRSVVANDIMQSPEAQGRVAGITNTVENSLKSRANSDISAYNTAVSNLSAANTALATAKRNYQNYGWTVATATAAFNASSATYSTMTALTTAHKSVVTADEKYLAASTAKVAYDAKKAEYDKANEAYQAALAAPLAKYQAAVALGSTITTAVKAYASAAAGLPNVAKFSTAANVQAQQLTQIYITLLNRAPTLSELYYASEQMAGGASLIQVTASLMAANPALFPSGQTNDAFVRLLYTNGLGRTADAGGVAFYTNQLADGTSRAELVTRFLTATNTANNTDTTAFNNRTRTILLQLGAASVGKTEIDAIIDAAAAKARQQTAAFNAAGVAALAASPDAQRTVLLTRLYVAVLGRTPDSGGLNFYADAMRRFPEITGESIAQLLLDSAEGQRLLPANLGSGDFVQAFFKQALGRTPTSAELAQFSAMLPARTRGQVAVAIINAVLNYQGTDRLQQTTQAGFNAKVSAALHQLVELAQEDDADTRIAIDMLEKLLAKPVPTLVLGELTSATRQVQSGERTASGGNQLTVDRWGNVLTVTDPRDPGFRITYQYGYDNQLVSQSHNAQGAGAPVSTTRYDALGRVAATIDFNGNKNAVTYDGLGNVIGEHHADGGVVTSHYNLFGNRLWVQQPSTTLASGTTLQGVLTNYGYDHLGNLTSSSLGRTVNVYVAINTGHGNVTPDNKGASNLLQRFEYDELGRQIRNIGADNVATVLQYDADGNVVFSATQDRSGANPNGNALLYRTTTRYDAEGNKAASRDGNGNTMVWYYQHGRLTSSIDMGGATTTYKYDHSARLLEQASTRGQKLTYGYTGDKLTFIDDAVSKMSTRYTYDAAGNRLSERQTYYGAAADAPPQLQNNTLRYDMQNRLESIKDDKYLLNYKYDNNGNRTVIESSYNGQAAVAFFNAYDAMNRQTVVNGEKDASGNVVFGKYGHAITYDKSGNRLTDTSRGIAVSNQGGSYGVVPDGVRVESYTYDNAGRLSTIRHDGLLIDTRLYDAGGRVSQSGITGADDITTQLLNALGITSTGRTYAYYVGGRLEAQTDKNAGGGVLQDIYFVKDAWNDRGGYDAMGNLTGYTVVKPGTKRDNNGRYIIEYALYDSYKEAKTTLATNNTSNISQYDENGNRIKVVDGQTGKVINRLWYDAAGHVQSHQSAGEQAEFNLIVNGQVYGVESGEKDLALGSNYMSVTSPSLSAAPSSYSVQTKGETLQSIAQNIWGDAGLWYLIADANALSSNAELTVGEILRIPTRVNTVSGDHQTFKPYDPTEMIGDTAPVMPVPQGGGGGCGGLGQLVMIVVAVVVTAYTGGLLAGAVNPVLAGALSGAAGSIASQAVGNVIGAQDGFSWKGVALAAIGGGVGGGVGAAADAGNLPSFFAGDKLGAFAARAALTNVVSQGVGVVTGMQNGFDWRSVAASAIASEVAGNLRDSSAFVNTFGKDTVFGNTVSGIVSGTVASLARGGKIDVVQIATDAFGNALGNSLAKQINIIAALKKSSEDLASSPEVETGPEFAPGSRQQLRKDVPNPNLDDGIVRSFMTGFGGKVDAIVESSESFQKMWSEAEKIKGYKIQISDDPNFSTSATGNVITLNKDVFETPERLVAVLTHEIAHVVYKNPNEGLDLINLIGNSSRQEFVSRFVQNQLLDEGQARFMEIKVQRETGVDLGALRDFENNPGSGQKMASIYEKYAAGEIKADKARNDISNLFRNVAPNHMSVTYQQKITAEAIERWNQRVQYTKTNINNFEQSAAALNAQLAYKKGSLERSEVRLRQSPNDPIALANKQSTSAAIASATAQLMKIQPQIDWYRRYGSKD